MNNIWTFLTQTLSVSVVALLLLFLKGIMADKLSPRWQYSVWCLLALRIIIPVASNQNIFLPVQTASAAHFSPLYIPLKPFAHNEDSSSSIGAYFFESNPSYEHISSYAIFTD